MLDKNELNWKNIYYNEEHDTDGSLISHEFTEECEYRNGWLIKDVYVLETEDNKEIRTQSITFVPGTNNE